MKTLRRSHYIVNGITVYRILAVPVLLWLLFSKHHEVFKWMLAISFLTDAVDGYLARRYQVVSMLGARLDSIGDDLTIAVAITGVFMLNFNFILDELIWIVVLVALSLLQVGLAFARYGKMTAFHTYIAKGAAVVQAAFLLCFFFFSQPSYILFYVTAIITGLDLLEEIVLIYLLPVYRLDVKGVYWVMRERVG